MNKIKTVSMLIVTLSLALAFLFHYISKQHNTNINSLSILHEQKSNVQEMAKAVFYLSKNQRCSNEELDDNIEKYLLTMTKKKDDSLQYNILVKLWDEFYALIQKFQKEQSVSSPYSSIVIDKLVNDIYTKNQQLIVAFDGFIAYKQKHYDEKLEKYQMIEDIFFLMAALLLIYLLTQVREIVLFIQKFTTTSKSIIQKATIKDLKPMTIHKNDEVLKEATENFNYLIEKIDKAIAHSQASITHTTMALEEVEQKIEDFLSLLSEMQDKESDTVSQKEDTVIDSLETLMNLTNQLKNLQQDLNKLTSSL